jgi:hypothetical protein
MIGSFASGARHRTPEFYGHKALNYGEQELCQLA